LFFVLLMISIHAVLSAVVIRTYFLLPVWKFCLIDFCTPLLGNLLVVWIIVMPGDLPPRPLHPHNVALGALCLFTRKFLYLRLSQQ
jgi:hypothetical protein